MQTATEVDAVISFTGENHFLSNFYPHPMEWRGTTARAAEYHYNAAKTLVLSEREKVYAAPTPGKAKQIGQRVTLRPNWDDRVRFDQMYSILRAKFADPRLQALLLSTGDALLVEGNNWHDQLWGDCNCPRHAKWPGKNMLGVMLMHIRSELRAEMDLTSGSQFTRVSLTGHRPHEFTADQEAWIKDRLRAVALRLKSHYGTRVAISGMALGADTWWAEAALEAGLRLWCYIPFEAQADKWQPSEVQRWRELRSEANREVVLGQEYDVRLLHCRNELMVRDSDMMTAVHLKERRSGGTVETIKKARRAGLPMLRLNVSDREVTKVSPGGGRW